MASVFGKFCVIFRLAGRGSLCSGECTSQWHCHCYHTFFYSLSVSLSVCLSVFLSPVFDAFTPTSLTFPCTRILLHMHTDTLLCSDSMHQQMIFRNMPLHLILTVKYLVSAHYHVSAHPPKGDVPSKRPPPYFREEENETIHLNSSASGNRKL